MDRPTLTSVVLVASSFYLLSLPGNGRAQCLLANPSFEVEGSGGAVFGGWNQFGDVGFVVEAAEHGKRAARVTGPNASGWSVSAYWQPLDAAPGQRFSVTAGVSHPASKPLNGDSRAIINVEWRNAAGKLIDYETHVVADASTAPDEIQQVRFTSSAAPPSTASTHLLLGVLQSPSDPVADVVFDQVTFEQSDEPLPEDPQWNDFPGGRTIPFSGFDWRVKGPIVVGSTAYTDTDDHVWVDDDGRLHMTLLYRDGMWHNTEVALEDPLGYGDYVFTTRADLDALDPQAILGLFLWQYTPCYLPQDAWWNPNNEVDIEFSRWGDPQSPVGQFVVQPYTDNANLVAFDVGTQGDERLSHAFSWEPDRLAFRSWRGGPDDESPETLVHAWVYDGPQVPRPEQPRVHVNLHKFSGDPVADQEIILEAFRFVPGCSRGDCTQVPSDAVALGPRATRLVAWPNPFNPQTSIRFAVTRPGPTELRVFDVSGRLVRTLVRERLGAGEYEFTWSGVDDAGRRVASGVYLLRFSQADHQESRRLVLLK